MFATTTKSDKVAQVELSLKQREQWLLYVWDKGSRQSAIQRKGHIGDIFTQETIIEKLRAKLE